MSSVDTQGRKRRPVLVQATIAPLDEDGITAFSAGSAVFAVLGVIALLRHDALEAAGQGWWLWVALSSLTIGLLAIGYCVWRRTHR